MQWDKLGKVADAQVKRTAVPVSPELRKIMELFRSKYPDRKFSDAKVLGTFIEAGARMWYAQLGKENG